MMCHAAELGAELQLVLDRRNETFEFRQSSFML